MPPSTKVICDHIDFSYGNNAVIKQFCAELSTGKIHIITGPSGAGKTTLLRLLAGELLPDSGTIERHELPCFYLAQHPQLKTKLTPQKLLLNFAKKRGDASLIDTAMHYFDLNTYADTRMDQLSAGYVQRVILAQLLCSPAPVWLLDTPFNNLDEEGAALLESLISTRAEQGGIIVIGTQNAIQSEYVSVIDLGKTDT